jgi:phage terminase Nu1 subunit (DNA packaging protein)
MRVHEDPRTITVWDKSKCVATARQTGRGWLLRLHAASWVNKKTRGVGNDPSLKVVQNRKIALHEMKLLAGGKEP